MEQLYEVKISVRELIEFILRSGDISSGHLGIFGNARAVEGTKAHKKIQSTYKEGYDSEVYLKHSLEYNDLLITIEGRADGILIENGKVVIDEIKTVSHSLDLVDENYNMLHWAQVKCYAYIYGIQNNLEEIETQLSYYQIDTEEIKYLRKLFDIEELEKFYTYIIKQYYIWANLSSKWSIKRDMSIKKLNFPFDKYRKGQRELAVVVYKTILKNEKIFIQAPTGIGKTISTLFPTIKALGERNTSKIFYLTAKTITRQVAEEAITIMSEKGLELKSLTITAKEKICFCNEVECNPENCIYAKGHFDRVNGAIRDVLENENIITRLVVEQYAQSHRVCPFELSLDLSIWADCVICDYNYVFDPRVYLRRFFSDNKGNFTFLIDEAHNLVDRSREMYSAQLNKDSFLELKKNFKDKVSKLSKAADKINKYLLEIRKKCNDKGYYIQKEAPKEILKFLQNFIHEVEDYTLSVKGEVPEELLNQYFNVISFSKIYDLYDEHFVTYGEKQGNDLTFKLFCLDPSQILSQVIKRGRAAIFFSATLTPLGYFRKILGGSEEDYMLKFASPFASSNLCLQIANNISTKYRNRTKSYGLISEYINAVISGKEGNYLIFFPSYEYMNNVVFEFSSRYPEKKIIVQTPSMCEEKREEFLENFKCDSSEALLGFAVLGGMYSEGVDLKGERLIGAVVVGVGLPKICFERDIIKDYFQKENNSGYEYAYVYPGMNKVLQAAGRVIRCESDKGIVLLIDERFTYQTYQDLFPEEWKHYGIVKEKLDIELILREFWR